MRKLSKVLYMLISLVGSFIGIVILAVINGTMGHLCAIAITVLGSIGVANMIGLSAVPISYSLIFILLVSFGVLRGALRYFEQYSNHYIAFRLLAIIRDKIFKILRKLCPAKLENKQKGDIISMISADIETLEVFYAHTLSPICIAVLVSIIMTVFIGYINIYLGIFALVSYIVVGVLIPKFTSKKTTKLGVEYKNISAKFSGEYLDVIKGSNEIVLYNIEDEVTKDINNNSNQLNVLSKDLKYKMFKSASFINLIVGGLVIGMLVISFYLKQNALISDADMIIAIVSLMSSFGAVIAVALLPNDLTQTFASANRIMDLMEELPEVEDVVNANDIEFNNLKVKNLNFGYNDSHQVVNNLSLEVNKGEIVGIIGKSGCGKSTLLKLLLRFWKTNGSIFINDIEINDINTNSLKSNIVMVSQSTYLFDKSIKENLLIAKPDATEEELIEACKCAAIFDVVDKLENKFDTVISHKHNFSQGERQRLGLARAFLSDANLILLDEVTSNVDCINEGIILNSIKENKYNKTMLIVSHKESTINVCSRYIKL
ncbi:MAG: ABC transporter ATP-binding protein [bacterium]